MSASLTARLFFSVAAIGLLLLSLLLSDDWFRRLPLSSDLTKQLFFGMILLKACLIGQAALCLLFALSSLCLKLLVEGRMPILASNFDGKSYMTRQQTCICLAVVTALAFLLRLLNLNSCLWLDEISPITFYRNTPPFGLFVHYYSTNLHLLNTLLVKLSICVFGEHEWAVRLPAMLFGAATVPATYWTARLALSRETSLSAAVLMTFSYHHIFFSQNARGYSAYIFFSLLSVGFLLRALAADRLFLWKGYALSSILNFASLMVSVLVFLSQVIIAVLVVAACRFKKGPAYLKIAAARLAVIFSFVFLWGIQLYALVIPQAIAVMQNTYHTTSAGYFIFSADFVGEILRNMREALGATSSSLLPPFILVGLGAGFVGVYLLFRRNYLLTLCLLLPNLFLAIFMLKEGMVVYPRFFILTLPLALMIVALLAENLAASLSERVKPIPIIKKVSRLSIQSTLVLLLAFSSAFALPLYYVRPKQDYLGAVQFLKPRCSAGYIVVALYHAEEGFSYYARRAGLEPNGEFFLVRSLDKFDQISNKFGQDKILLVTTFPRSLALDHPELKERIEKLWKVEKVFSGTIGGGDICVWSPMQ